MKLNALNPFSDDFFIRQDYVKAKKVFIGGYNPEDKTIKYKAAHVAKVVFGVFAVLAPIAVIVFLAIPLYPAAIAAGVAFVAFVALRALTGFAITYMPAHGLDQKSY